LLKNDQEDGNGGAGNALPKELGARRQAMLRR